MNITRTDIIKPEPKKFPNAFEPARKIVELIKGNTILAMKVAT